MNYTLGIDVSEWQNGQVNWTQAISQGVRFVFIRGAYGVTKDTRFDLHWGSSKGKVYRGVYLYFRDGQDPIQEAQNLYNFCAAHGDFGELPPALDIEEYGNTQITPSKVKACLEKLEQLFGVKPLVYTAKAVWDKWLGNVAWAREYDLWCSNPPYTQWFDTLIETVKSLDPALWPKKPLPWQGLMQLFWQIAFKAPASMHGVPGTELDLNLFSGTEQELADYANGTINPPPPDPIGETLMQFKAKYTVNVRSGPNTTYPDIGDLAAGTIITAYEIQATDNNSVWVRFGDGKWVALVHNGGGPYLEFSPAPPVPVVTLQTTTATNLRWYSEVNGQGKPIMSMPPSGNRPAYTANKTIVAKPGIIDADGVTNYHEVLSGSQAIPPTYVPPAGYTGWFVRADDVFTVS